jgi:hypothetical protein
MHPLRAGGNCSEYLPIWLLVVSAEIVHLQIQMIVIVNREYRSNSNNLMENRLDDFVVVTRRQRCRTLLVATYAKCTRYQ